MSGMKTTRTPEDWDKVDPLYLMQRVARGETSGTAAFNVMRDALADIAFLAQRCRDLEAKQTRTEKARSDWEENATLLEQERDTLRAEVEQLREIREIASQCAVNGGYLCSADLIELRELLKK